MRTVKASGLDRAKHLGIPTEEQEQRALATWLDLMRLTWCHVPNGGARHAAVAGKLRAAGVKAGVPDILIFDRPTVCKNRPPQPHRFVCRPSDHECHLDARGVAVELKRRDGGRLSASQREWLDRLEALGWVCVVAYGADAAIKALTEMGFAIRKPPPQRTS